MSFQPISEQKFNELVSQGVTPQQIVEFEKRRKAEETTAKPKKGFGGVLKGLGMGAVKSAVSTVSGMSKIGDAVLGGVYGGFHADAPSTQRNIETRAKMDAFATPQSRSESVGKFVTDVAQFAIPAGKVAKLGKVAGLGPKALAGVKAVTAGTVGTVKTGDLKSGAIAATASLVAPSAVKVVAAPFKLANTLLTKLGAGLAGVDAKLITQIANNPGLAVSASRELKTRGATHMLEQNSQKILSGVHQIKTEASKAYGDSLSKLSSSQIQSTLIKSNLNKALVDSGVKVVNGKINLSGTEIINSKIQGKLSSVITDLNKMKIQNGADLKRAIDFLDTNSFKISGKADADRMVFNSIVSKLKLAATKTLNESSDNAIKSMNRAYHADMNITDSIQGIFGKMKFYNAKELLTASKKLETIFQQKGLTEKTVDTFLERINQNVPEFMTKEAVRQVAQSSTTKTAAGLSFAEVTRAFTSTVLPPKVIQKVAVASGLGENILKPVLEKIAPVNRAAFIEMLVRLND